MLVDAYVVCIGWDVSQLFETQPLWFTNVFVIADVSLTVPMGRHRLPSPSPALTLCTGVPQGAADSAKVLEGTAETKWAKCSVEGEATGSDMKLSVLDETSCLSSSEEEYTCSLLGEWGQVL